MHSTIPPVIALRSITHFPGRLSLRRSFVLIAFALAGWALPPAIRAVLPAPPPDGGYPNQNTAEGDDALFNLTIGINNTAIGYRALFLNDEGGYNTACGALALRNNTTGDYNTAIGAAALNANTTGYSNTATGYQTLYSNTTGQGNTANGIQVLYGNTTGEFNTAMGLVALSANTTGHHNTACGVSALGSNVTGVNNTAIGYGALDQATADNNTASGYEALFNNTTGANNIALGRKAGFQLTTGDNNIDIGAAGVAAEANTIRIGTKGQQTATIIAGISGVTVGGGVGVVINANGRLGTVVSSRRFKENVQDMDQASEAILALRPVAFHYKPELDPEHIPQYGLIAEEVEKVSPDLVARDAEGQVFTVRYEAVNAMLLNEFLKEHRKVEARNAEQQKENAGQREEIRALKTALKEEAAMIQEMKEELASLKAQRPPGPLHP